MREVPTTLAHAGRPVLEEWVLSAIGRNFKAPFDRVQAGVARLAALRAIAMRAHDRRRVADLPLVAAGPKRRHGLPHAGRIGERHVQRHIQERLGMRLGGVEGDFRHHVDLGLWGIRSGGFIRQDSQAGQRQDDGAEFEARPFAIGFSTRESFPHG